MLKSFVDPFWTPFVKDVLNIAKQSQHGILTLISETTGPGLDPVKEHVRISSAVC